MLSAAIVGAGPASAVGTIDVPNCTASVGNAPVSSPIVRLTQPRRGRRAGVGVLDLLHRGEVRAVRAPEADGVHRGEPSCCPELPQRRQRGVQPEHVVRCDQAPSGTAIVGREW